MMKITRTLVATVLYGSKGKEIYCRSNQINDQHINTLRKKTRTELEDAGFTFVQLVSPEYSNVRGYAIFYEGHGDEMIKALIRA
ncbi:MAG: hypothetical protein ABFC94_19145 [Syntrophomonas sp.]